jgi:ribosomal protein S27AE
METQAMKGGGRWMVLERCPTCGERNVAATLRGREVRCGACGCVSWAVELEETK